MNNVHLDMNIYSHSSFKIFAIISLIVGLALQFKLKRTSLCRKVVQYICDVAFKCSKGVYNVRCHEMRSNT